MFQINSEWWNIEFVSPFDYHLRKSNGDYAIAVCDDREKTIFLQEHLSGMFLKKVLCHEITHAAMFSYNVDLNIEQEELVADLMSTYGKEIVKITDKVFRKIYEETYY